MAQSIQAQTAKAIRAELKAAGIKASVTSSSASMLTKVDVDLGVTTAATAATAKAICQKYQYGDFNGQIDCYEFTNKRKDLPQVKFVFVNYYENEAA